MQRLFYKKKSAGVDSQGSAVNLNQGAGSGNDPHLFLKQLKGYAEDTNRHT